jgi:glutathione S-transferase
MITLYHRTDCPFCWKVRLGFDELQIDYNVVNTRLGEKHPDVLRLNPKGSVPVLVDGDTVIWESNTILEYLDEKYAQGILYPGAAEQRAQVRLLQSYSDTVVGAALREIVFEKRSKPEEQWDTDKILQGEDAWRECLRQLSNWLNGNNYFCEKFSAAECALLPRFGTAEAYGAPGIDEFPFLKRWFSELKQRTSYKETYPDSFIRYNRST